ncbi:ATP12 family chaperone protein [Falsirhodobacter halotolerans]|uniref:ATP12 family chaperone protein n=1 Tax=Falsirhodobacter halotolerans TaxID=1146892 RepID=UPI001FD4DC54|nr:ATP12 family protein [Falsirhodobacter halotolerans]MCJ8138550.1 ATPase [Falsirhodobacter halotolerans]
MNWAPKRFWTAATVQPDAGGFTVHLDGRPVRTPAKTPLIVPTEALAARIAAEWDRQEGLVRPDTMPATRSANSALDKVAPHRAAVIAEIANYGASDLLCYRAEGPMDLVTRQQAWDTLLDWAAGRFGSRLIVTIGILPVAQPADILSRLTAEVAAKNDFELAALHDLVAISGSLILGLAVAEGHITPAHAFSLSRIDEAYQADIWGVDEEAARTDAVRQEAFLEAAAIFLLCR